MEAVAYAYLGHFAGRPHDVALVTAEDYQDALDWCDAVGQPDEGSFQAVQDPLVLRLHASLADEGDDAFVEFTPHPAGAVAWGARDLARILRRIESKASTITGDVIRSYGPWCTRCQSFHFPNQPCRTFVEPVDALLVHLGILDDDPHQVVIVAGPEDEDELEHLAQRAGRRVQFLLRVPSGVLVNVRFDSNGHATSDPNNPLYDEDQDWLEPLLERLQD